VSSGRITGCVQSPFDSIDGRMACEASSSVLTTWYVGPRACIQVATSNEMSNGATLAAPRPSTAENLSDFFRNLCRIARVLTCTYGGRSIEARTIYLSRK